MAKEYFSHDYYSRNDPKMVNLQIKHGMTGIGIYWCIVEQLYEQYGRIKLEYERIAFDLRTNNECIKSVIHDFDLFVIEGDYFYSRSVLERIEQRCSKSVKARESVKKRWAKYERNTNVSKNDTIKGKESNIDNSNNSTVEVKEVKDTTVTKSEKAKIKFEADKKKFKAEVGEHLQEFGRELCNQFFLYWTEPNKSKTRMKWQMQETWDTHRRLLTFQRNEDKFAKNKKTGNTGQDISRIVEGALENQRQGISVLNPEGQVTPAMESYLKHTGKSNT